MQPLILGDVVKNKAACSRKKGKDALASAEKRLSEALLGDEPVDRLLEETVGLICGTIKELFELREEMEQIGQERVYMVHIQIDKSGINTEFSAKGDGLAPSRILWVCVIAFMRDYIRLSSKNQRP
jgi:hypothetical protein